MSALCSARVNFDDLLANYFLHNTVGKRLNGGSRMIFLFEIRGLATLYDF